MTYIAKIKTRKQRPGLKSRRRLKVTETFITTDLVPLSLNFL